MKTEETVNIRTLPVVPLRGVVLFPDMTLHFDIGRKSSLAALKSASQSDGEMFFIAQKNIDEEDPKPEGLYPVGVIGKVRQIVRMPEQRGAVRVIVDGLKRAKILAFSQKLPYIKAEVEELKNDNTLPAFVENDRQTLEEAMLFSVKRYFEEYCEHAPQVTPDIITDVYKSKKISELSDLIAGNILLSMDEKNSLLAELNVYARCEMLCVILANEIQVLILDEKLENKVQEQMDKNQREYYLREEMKAITEELEDIDGGDETGLYKKISESGMSDGLKEKLFAELDRMKRLPQSSPDSNVQRTYIEKCLDIPWGKYSKENKNLAKAEKILNGDHYGLKEVKERMTEMLASLIVSPEIKGQIICLAGPPGVGKTSVARSIANATGRKYVRVSLGGVKDEAEIRGHRRTYIGAMPGRIINALTDAGTMNPLILLDEVDKLGGDFKGDPASALLEALDGEQNFSFRDHYIELPVDLSKVLFITTANDKYAIPDALRDRMEIIDIPGYTYEEKFHIAKKHLVPKQYKEHSLTKDNIHISDRALRCLIDGYTREAGVRQLERQIAKLCRKETVRLASGNTEKLEITDKNIEEFAGVKKFRSENEKRQDETGLVNGLAWTAAGGELLQVEVAVLDGTGKLELTGSLGDVMKESARAALSYIRSRCAEYGIDCEFYKNKDIHIHFPEGAVPKDGPSAGITVTTALVSALTGRKVRSDIAMTGEITLRGRVLQIGGLREKSMAAYREGIKYVYIPYSNLPDLEDIDEAVKAKITFVPAKTADDVLPFVLLPAEKEAENKTAKNSDKPILPIPEFREQRGRKGELQ